MRILIVGSPAEDAERIKKTIAAHRIPMSVAGCCTSVQSAFEWLNDFGQPDVLMMDVQLVDGLSFEVLNYLSDQVNVIFMLPVNKALTDVFAGQSISYLTKPLCSDAIKDILDIRHKKINRIELYESLLNSFFPRPVKKMFRKIIVKKGSEYHIIPVMDVVYFSTDNGIVYVTTKENQRHIISGCLQEISDQLDEKLFYRVSPNFVVHAAYLKGFRKTGYKIELIFTVPVKDEIFVNSYRITEFKDWLEKSQAPAMLEVLR